MQLRALWSISGICVERRELTSPKNKDWRGYFCRVATKGVVVDVDLTPEQFKLVPDGGPVEMTGTFKQNDRGLKLVAGEVLDLSTGEVRK